MAKNFDEELKRFQTEISSNAVPKPNSHQKIQKKLPIYSTAAKPVLYPRQITNSVQSPAFHPVTATIKPTVLAKPQNFGKNIQFSNIQADVQKKLKQLKEKVIVRPQLAEVAISQGKASKSMQSAKPYDKRNKGTDKNLLRTSGGQTWEDTTLADWGDNDFRIFCGDLGNDVNDDVLIKAFNKYPSFLKARVIRDKRTSKSKGYGFVSFKDPADFTRAVREMNGCYVGSRPIKLKKSTWKNRAFSEVKKKENERMSLVNKLNQM